MELKCNAICKKINKKSKSPAFADMREGDEIRFSVELNRAGKYINYLNVKGNTVIIRGSCAKYIHCLNVRTNMVSILSFNQLGNVLENFEFEQIS